jgi:hypothetical protein
MQTVVDINNTLKNIVASHDQLKSFHTFSLDELDMDKLDVDKYPLLYGQCSNAELDASVTVFTYEIIVADLAIEKQEELLTQIYSETFLILQDVAAKFRFAVYGGNTTVDGNWNFELPLSCDPFTARFDNLLTGWSTSFDIRLPNVIDLCDAPYS